MPSVHSLQPTVWRTCRVLANRTRLRIFRLLVHRSNQTVSAIAQGLDRPLPVISQYLRALEARSLLTVCRMGRQVYYRTDPTIGNARELVSALRSIFKKDTETIEEIYKLATAFTHPRRVEIYRVLKMGPRSMEQIQIATGISSRALTRHLQKLEARGFVSARLKKYSVVDCPSTFGRALARLAAEEGHSAR
jgi:DNA-binding transcriptional ArsR family regulator